MSAVFLFFFVFVYSILVPQSNHHHHTIVPTPFQYLIVSNNRNRTINFVFFYVIRFSFISIACSTNENNGVFFDWHFFFTSISVWFCVCAASLGQCSYYVSLFDKQILMKMKKKKKKKQVRRQERQNSRREHRNNEGKLPIAVRIDAQIIIFVSFACSSLQPWHYLRLNFANLHELLSVRLSMD